MKNAVNPDTYVTIDWDYFIAYDTMWDFGAAETPTFQSMAWTTRLWVASQMNSQRRERGWWDNVLRPNLILPQKHYVRVSDSHLAAWMDPELHQCRQVLLVDHHHDCYGDGRRRDCGNWLRHWLDEDPKRSALWLKSEDSIHEVPEEYTRRVVVIDEEHIPEQLNVRAVHICRSAGWSPPWTDGPFRRFVESVSSGKHAQLFDTSAFTSRWNLRMYQQARQIKRVYEQARTHFASEGKFIL